jgi:hypothetical protein
VSVAGLSFGFFYPVGDDSFHFELMVGPGAAERPAYKHLHDSYNMLGWHHPGFTVDSVDDVIDELKRRNVTIATMERSNQPPPGHRSGARTKPQASCGLACLDSSRAISR